MSKEKPDRGGSLKEKFEHFNAFLRHVMSNLTSMEKELWIRMWGASNRSRICFKPISLLATEARCSKASYYKASKQLQAFGLLKPVEHGYTTRYLVQCPYRGAAEFPLVLRERIDSRRNRIAKAARARWGEPEPEPVTTQQPPEPVEKPQSVRTYPPADWSRIAHHLQE